MRQLSTMRKLAWRPGLTAAFVLWTAWRSAGRTSCTGAMADAPDLLCGSEGTDPLTFRPPLFGTRIGVAGFGGLRLGERNALRVHVNGS